MRRTFVAIGDEHPALEGSAPSMPFRTRHLVQTNSGSPVVLDGLRNFLWAYGATQVTDVLVEKAMAQQHHLPTPLVRQSLHQAPQSPAHGLSIGAAEDKPFCRKPSAYLGGNAFARDEDSRPTHRQRHLSQEAPPGAFDGTQPT